jgi:magnesium chelatase family protein
MSYAKVLAVGLVGLAGHLVEVEADLAAGLPGLTLTGLPDAALFEARDRVRAALVNSGETWPNRRITVNLLPAALPKHGSVFDLAIAVGVLAGAGELPLAPLHGVVLLGELGLDGTVRSVRGVLPGLLAAARAGITRAVVPVANAREAALVPGVAVRATDSLRRLIDFVRGSGPLLDAPAAAAAPASSGPDLADVVGQELGRRGLELAAAGGHHLSLVGPPGAGKTMLARRLPSILPPLSDAAALEVTAVHSIAGALPPDAPLIRQPPFQAPHHTASVAALAGGGSGLARPGAISLAHLGVLFLDDARYTLSLRTSRDWPRLPGWGSVKAVEFGVSVRGRARSAHQDGLWWPVWLCLWPAGSLVAPSPSGRLGRSCPAASPRLGLLVALGRRHRRAQRRRLWRRRRGRLRVQVPPQDVAFAGRV